MNQPPMTLSTQQLAGQTTSVPNTPLQIPTNRPQRQVLLKPSKKDLHLAATRQVIDENFLHCISPTRAHYLVHKDTQVALPAEAENLVGLIKKIAADIAGVDLSRGTISSAIEILREEPPADCKIGYGRSLRSPMGALYVQSSHGAIYYPRGQKCFSHVENVPEIGFLSPLNAKHLHLNAWHNIDKQQVMQLFELTNLPRDCSLLVISWLILAWIPDTQKVLLELTGGRRSGKSSAQVLLKQLIDPSSENLTRDIPKTRAATQALAQLNQVLSLDQVDSLTDGVQEALVHLQQGDTIKWKQNRAREDTYVRVSCPVILNSLTSVVTDPELSDSTVTIELPKLADPTSKIPTNWELSTIQTALLAILGDVHAQLDYFAADAENSVPTAMQHFCRVGCLVARSLGGEAQDFLDQLEANRQRRYEIALEDSPIALAIRDYINARNEDVIELPVGALLTELQSYKPDWTTSRNWPATPKGLGTALREIEPLMQVYGVQIAPLEKKNGLCRVQLTRTPPELEPLKEPDSFPTPSFCDGSI